MRGVHAFHNRADEPASMLDPAGRAEVLAIVRDLRAAGTGVMHVTHDLADIAHLQGDKALQRFIALRPRFDIGV